MLVIMFLCFPIHLGKINRTEPRYVFPLAVAVADTPSDGPPGFRYNPQAMAIFYRLVIEHGELENPLSMEVSSWENHLFLWAIYTMAM